MTEITIVSQNFNGDEIQAVSARTLYEFLGLSKRHYSSWFDSVIIHSEYAFEGEDYIITTDTSVVNPDALLHIDFCKRIAMRTKSAKGEEVRQYFINIEKSYKKVVEKIKTPKTYLEALKEAVMIQEQLELTSGKLVQAEETIKSLTHSGRTYTSTEIAKELGMRSAQQLNNAMKKREMQYWINETWVLRSWYADKEYTSMKQVVLDNGKIIYNRHWTEKGRQFLIKKFTEKAKNTEETKLLN